MRFAILITLSFLLFTACQPSEDAALAEAQRLHRQVVELETRLLTQYQRLERPDSAQQAWYEEFKEWQSNLVVVPGVEHDHSHDDHHHHDHLHEAAPQLTSEQLLDVQKSLLEEGKNLEKQWETTLPNKASTVLN